MSGASVPYPEPRVVFGVGSSQQPLPVVHRCGKCNNDGPPLLLRKAWQGMRVGLEGWGLSACRAAALSVGRGGKRCDAAAATVTVDNPELFEAPPVLDLHGSLNFTIHAATQLYLVCYTTCVAVDVAWDFGARLPPLRMSTTLRVSRDPCGAANSCKRSWFLSSQFDCSIGRQLDSLFSRFDGELRWGLGQTIAFIGAAARPREMEFRPFHGGDPAYDEPVMSNPSWDAVTPAGHSKLLGSSSFLPAPQTKKEVLRHRSIGFHEYAVAWCAVQDSNFVHKYCKGLYKERFGCNASSTPGGDAHSAVMLHFSRYGTHFAEAELCMPAVRRPASLTFNAQAYMLQVYAGASGQRSMRKDDHYIDLELGVCFNKSSRAMSTGFGSVPQAFVERLLHSLLWLERHHATFNITVVCVSVLTLQRFETDPVADERLTAATRRLQAAGVVLLANAGNCRFWYQNCTGLPWPAIASGFTPVAAATVYNEKFNTLGANKFSSCDVLDCSFKIPAVCGASVTSSALPFFASSVLLMREAIEATGFLWQVEGHTLQQAILSIVHKTGKPLKRNTKATHCSNRKCIHVEGALNYIRGNIRQGRMSRGSVRGQ